MKTNRAIWAIATAGIVLGSALLACGPTTDDGLLGGGANGNGNGGGSGWGPGGGGGPTYSGNGDGGVQQAIAEKLFRDVEAQLKMRCGNSCHESGVNAKDYKWLAGPDAYASIKKYPGIVLDDLYASKLENHPANHPTQSLVGPGNPSDPMLLDAVTKWLGAEAAALQNTPLPSTDPVDPTAGSVDLTKAGLAGGKITWTAMDLGNGLMRFANVQLVAPANSGAHTIAPLFVQVPAMGAEVHDLTNSTVDLTVGAGQSGSVVALLYFYNWKASSKLRIEFQKLETATVVDGGMAGCKDVGTFQTSAAPQLQQMCVSCHGGANQTAQNALDMKSLTGQVNFANACLQARNKINFNNKAQSPIIVTPVQKLNNHPFQVPGGNAAAYTNAMTTWINKE